MTTNASINFATEFGTIVKKEYQKGSLLMDTVRVKKGVVGSTHRFPKMNKGIATPRIPQTDVVPMNLGHSYADAVLTDWNAPDYSDKFDLAALTFDEKREIMDSSIMAVGRRLDQMILDAVAASAFATQVATSVGGTDTGLNLEKILRAKRLLDDNGVPQSDRHMVCSTYALEQALLETTVTSGDYNVIKPLVSGELTSFAGFKFHVIEARDEGGVPLSTNTRNNFAYHKDAVGLAIGLDMQSSVDWVPEKTSWLMNTLFKAGAVTVDTDGVIDVLTYEA